MDLKTFFQKQAKTLIGILIGASVGYAYYNFIGCESGSCPITSDPFISILYGSMMGGLAFNSLANKNEGNPNKKDIKIDLT